MHLTKRQVQGCQLLKILMHPHGKSLHDVNETAMTSLLFSLVFNTFGGTALNHMLTMCSTKSHLPRNLLKMRAHSSFSTYFSLSQALYKEQWSAIYYSSYVTLLLFLLFLTYLCCSIIKTNNLFVCGSRLRIFIILLLQSEKNF